MANTFFRLVLLGFLIGFYKFLCLVSPEAFIMRYLNIKSLCLADLMHGGWCNFSLDLDQRMWSLICYYCLCESIAFCFESSFRLT